MFLSAEERESWSGEYIGARARAAGQPIVEKNGQIGSREEVS